MLFKIPDPSAANPKTPADGAPRVLPFTKVGPLAVIAFLTVIVVALAILLSQLKSASSTKAPAADPDAQSPVGMVRDQRIEVLDEGELAAQYPSLVRDELQKEIFDWFQTPGRQAVTDQRDEIESEWAGHLLSDDVRPRLERLPGWVFGELAEPDRVVAEPGGRRGTLVQVWGAVQSIEPIDLPVVPKRPAWRVRIDAPSGQSWTLIAVREPPESIRPGTYVRANGVFVKLCPIEGGRPSFVVLTAQSILPSFPPAAEKEISAEWAAEVHDETIEKSQRRPGEEESYWRLMNYVRTLGPDGYRAKVKSGELKVTDMSGARGATDLAERPALHRFELVRLRVGIPQPGSDGAFVVEQDLFENVGNIRSVLRGFVLDDQGRVIWVMTPFGSDAFRFAGARLGMIEGFFYKRVAVETKKGGLYYMPVVVATSIVAIDTSKPPSEYAKWAAWTAIAGALICAALFVMLVSRRRRERVETRRRHEERVARRASSDGPAR
ncbi:MAG: hypothetical protein K8T90_15480 [Planctomycetes bacterium]|nr:hypothetical protein [Planctomycetota bacterium]